jgi:hypothetical protein
MKVVISGYTYTRQNLFEVFDSYPHKEELTFVLPNNWTAKMAKLILNHSTNQVLKFIILLPFLLIPTIL